MNPQKEPVAWGGSITALAVATFPMLRAFGVDVTVEQSDALLGFLAALIVVGTLVVRANVVPLGKAENAVETALNTVAQADTGKQAKGIISGK